MQKLTANQVHKLTEQEINTHLYRDAHPAEFRGLRDGLTDEAIIALLDHECWEYFSESFRSWVWDTISVIDIENDAGGCLEYSLTPVH